MYTLALKARTVHNWVHLGSENVDNDRAKVEYKAIDNQPDKNKLIWTARVEITVVTSEGRLSHEVDLWQGCEFSSPEEARQKIGDAIAEINTWPIKIEGRITTLNEELVSNKNPLVVKGLVILAFEELNPCKKKNKKML